MQYIGAPYPGMAANASDAPMCIEHVSTRMLAACKSRLPDGRLQDGRRLVLSPYTLSSGPLSGLCNQVFALAGYVMMAKELRAILLLPNLTSHAANGVPRSFDHYFEPAPFIRSLRLVGVTGWSELPKNETRLKIARTKTNLDGWHTFKHQYNSTVHTGVLEAVLSGLQPAIPLRQRVKAIQSHRLGGGEPYGCLHARIERDMVKGWLMNRAGRPPDLAHTLASMAVTPAVRQTARRIFVAVGNEISSRDNETLSAPTSWNATLVRTPNKQGLSMKSWGVQAPDYTEAAIVDLVLCREAEWLVGWPGSSFSRALAFYHLRSRGSWHASCHCGSTCHEPTSQLVYLTSEPWKNACPVVV